MEHLVQTPFNKEKPESQESSSIRSFSEDNARKFIGGSWLVEIKEGKSKGEVVLPSKLFVFKEKLLFWASEAKL